MTLNRILRPILGVFAALLLATAPSCKRGPEEPKEMQDISKNIGELDKLNQKANLQGSEQSQKLKEAGVNDVKLSAETMQLTDEQRTYLEERVKSEKNSSYQALLQDILDKDKEIKSLNQKMEALRKILPKPDRAKEGDSHYTMALRFLRKRGVTETEAKRLVSRVNIMEKLAQGFEVYHFYNNGVYGTWVTQGKARITPNDLIREEREKIEGERDTAVAQNEVLQEEVNDLVTQKQQLQSDVEGLRTEKTTLIKDVEKLTTTNEEQRAKLNSIHYKVGNRKQLEQDGVIIVPVFAKDRAGAKWGDGVFDQHLDLRSGDTITINAADQGLKKISKVYVIPGSFLKDQHYKLTISEDKASATIKILEKNRFLNEKVVFAVTD